MEIEAIVGTRQLASSSPRSAVAAVHVHPDFDYANLRWDVALIKLANKQSVTTVSVASKAEVTAFLKTTSSPWFAGWGATTRSASGLTLTLHHADLGVTALATCAKEHLAAGTPHLVTAAHICAGGGKAGLCPRDSGGPLMTAQAAAGKILGIASFAGNSGCGSSEPGVFTSAATFQDWAQRCRLAADPEIECKKS